MYIGRGSSRSVVTAIVVVCSILCVGFMLFANAFLGFYLGICNTRFVEKNCINEGVSARLGLTSDDMHKVIEQWMSSLKKGTEPSANVIINGDNVEFFSTTDKEIITQASKRFILLRRLSYTFIGIAIALFLIVLLEGRAIILRNTIAITWGILLFVGAAVMIFVQMNPAKFREGFFTDVIMRGKALEGWRAEIINHAMIKNGFVMEVCLFLIVQLLFLVFVNGFTGSKKDKKRRR